MKRRDFLRAGLVTTASAGALSKTAHSNSQSREVDHRTCYTVLTGSHVELCAPTFSFRIDASHGLHALSWENKATGQTVRLGGGAELETDIDAADYRIWIPGWYGTLSNSKSAEPDEDPGYRDGYASPEYDATAWQGRINLTRGVESPESFTWARTRIVVPSGARRKALSLTLGGFGLFDHRFMRVFLNGHNVGTRRTAGRWHEPLTIDLGPGSSAGPLVRFGDTNLIAVQLSEFVTRPMRLNDLDPEHARSLPGSLTWPFSPAQFEQYLAIGKPFETLQWSRANLISRNHGSFGEAIFDMRASVTGLSALVTYRWNLKEPALHKFVQIRNNSPEPKTILNVRLGTYRTGAAVSEGEQGFPVYINEHFFMGLAHPCGWATGEEGVVRLRQYPGAKLAHGKTFKGMEVVYGVTTDGNARKAFLAHLQRRMRRVVRGHHTAYAFFEPFGAQPDGGPDETEVFALDNIAKVANGQRESNCHFDRYTLEFWVDFFGDLKQPDPHRFPHGFAKIIPKLKELGTALGLWIDSSWERWSVGGNIVVWPDLSNDPQYGTQWGALCRATEPIKSMYSQAFRYHIRENNVRLIKFDNFRPLCYNPTHDHLPGVYSTEAIGNAVIDTFHDLDEENPDVFLMLYWGYRSPWWLLHADTLFESGLAMEASSLGPWPTLYARDSVTVGLDQAHWYCEDVPWLGKDSLGIWLSDWGWWNSSIGKERWQEGFVMDMCRGSLLAQPWSDAAWLSPSERKQMAVFIALLKERADCFGNSSFVLGSPWKREPYGYVCSSGRRAFIALNNCTWKDVSLTLQLNPLWRLSGSSAWNLYRWYPDPAQLSNAGSAFGEQAEVLLRPFEVVLLETVPLGETPSLGYDFPTKRIRRLFEGPTLELAIETSVTRGRLEIKGMLPPIKRGGTLAISVEVRKGSVVVMKRDIGKDFDLHARIGTRDVHCNPVLGKVTYPAAWQAWRLRVEESTQPQEFACFLESELNDGEVLTCKAHLLPDVVLT